MALLSLWQMQKPRHRGYVPRMYSRTLGRPLLTTIPHQSKGLAVMGWLPFLGGAIGTALRPSHGKESSRSDEEEEEEEAGGLGISWLGELKRTCVQVGLHRHPTRRLVLAWCSLRQDSKLASLSGAASHLMPMMLTL